MREQEQREFLEKLCEYVTDLGNSIVYKREETAYDYKEFLIVLGGGYAVRHNGKIVFHTNQPYATLQEYNKIVLSNEIILST